MESIDQDKIIQEMGDRFEKFLNNINLHDALQNFLELFDTEYIIKEFLLKFIEDDEIKEIAKELKLGKISRLKPGEIFNINDYWYGTYQIDGMKPFLHLGSKNNQTSISFDIKSCQKLLLLIKKFLGV
jgi:hypothetical protein